MGSTHTSLLLGLCNLSKARYPKLQSMLATLHTFGYASTVFWCVFRQTDTPANHWIVLSNSLISCVYIVLMCILIGDTPANHWPV